MIALHDAQVLLVVRQVQVASLTHCRGAQAYGFFVLLLRLSKRAVVEAELLAERYLLITEHADRVCAVAAHLVDRLTVRTATVTQATAKVAVQDWIYCQYIIAVGVVHVTLKSDVVEVRQVFRQFLAILALLDHVLLLVPVPRTVDLAEVLDDKSVARQAFLAVAEDADTLRVHLKVVRI